MQIEKRLKERINKPLCHKIKHYKYTTKIAYSYFFNSLFFLIIKFISGITTLASFIRHNAKTIPQLWLASAPSSRRNSQPSCDVPTEPLYLPQMLNTKSSAGIDAHLLGAYSAARAKHRATMVVIFC